MTQHPSLRSSAKSKQHRSVLKRFERLKYLKEKGDWEEDMSIFGLPKIKILKFKIKKEKAPAEEAVAAGVEGTEGAVAKEAAEGAPAKEGVSAKGGSAPTGKKEGKEPTKTAPPPKKEEKGKK